MVYLKFHTDQSFFYVPKKLHWNTFIVRSNSTQTDTTCNWWGWELYQGALGLAILVWIDGHVLFFVIDHKLLHIKIASSGAPWGAPELRIWKIQHLSFHWKKNYVFIFFRSENSWNSKLHENLVVVVWLQNFTNHSKFLKFEVKHAFQLKIWI